MHVSYLNPLTPSKFNDTVANMAALIRDKFPSCTTVVGRGFSGAMLVPALAVALNVEWAIARKEGDGSHSGNRVEVSDMLADGNNIVFVDDLIDSGTTFLEVMDSVGAYYKKKGFPATFIGAALYVCSYGDTFHDMPVYSIHD